MFSVKVLSVEDTKKYLKMSEVIDTVENVYKQKAMDKTVVWPLIFYEFDPGTADMDIKSGWLKGSGIFGLKLVSFFGNNAEKDLPTLVGTVMVMDDKTGAPLGFLDGGHITGMRTGAAGAIGAKYLANKNSKNLLIVGSGHIAAFEIAASLEIFPDLEKVYIYNSLNFNEAKKFAAEIPARLHNEFGMDEVKASFVPVSDEECPAATADSQIIITVTPSKKPIIKKEWVSPGTHFSCIGADMSGKEEIDPEILAMARVFTDDKPQCINVGEIEIPVKMGILKTEDIAGEIGQVITREVEGRQSSDQITVFDATGIALLDLATAQLALKKADAEGQAQTVMI